MGILFLIGPRASGKTLAAKLLGAMYACRTCDTDRLVLAAEGRSIADIVAEEGWEVFRAVEKKVLAEAARRMTADVGTPAVIATGGGVVLDQENRELMREAGTVAYLNAPADVLISRLTRVFQGPDSGEISRPPLTNLDFADEIRATLTARDPLYRETAHHIVNAALEPEIIAGMLHDIASMEEGT